MFSKTEYECRQTVGDTDKYMNAKYLEWLDSTIGKGDILKFTNIEWLFLPVNVRTLIHDRSKAYAGKHHVSIRKQDYDAHLDKLNEEALKAQRFKLQSYTVNRRLKADGLSVHYVYADGKLQCQPIRSAPAGKLALPALLEKGRLYVKPADWHRFIQSREYKRQIKRVKWAASLQFCTTLTRKASDDLKRVTPTKHFKVLGKGEFYGYLWSPSQIKRFTESETVKVISLFNPSDANT